MPFAPALTVESISVPMEKPAWRAGAKAPGVLLSGSLRVCSGILLTRADCSGLLQSVTPCWGQPGGRHKRYTEVRAKIRANFGTHLCRPNYFSVSILRHENRLACHNS